MKRMLKYDLIWVGTGHVSTDTIETCHVLDDTGQDQLEFDRCSSDRVYFDPNGQIDCWGHF